NDADHDDYAPLYPEVIPRIDAAINYLKALGIERIYLVSHSQGALMTSYYLSLKQPGIIQGFVAIGMPGAAKYPAMDSLIALKQFALPMLDLYGSEDLPQVLAARDDKRKAALSVTGRDFEQIEIKSANHFFNGRNDILIKTVNQWLVKHR
ncbi:MAG: pimeloyl-ACP methyl ester carboxylesterase, partial [Planctomycetota bacterium]